MNGKQTLLRIFVGESDKHGAEPLYSEIAQRARKLGLAGCTVFRGIAGFGASSVAHGRSLSTGVPVVLEFVDELDRVRALVEEIGPLLQGALVTEETVLVHDYRAAPNARS